MFIRGLKETKGGGRGGLSSEEMQDRMKGIAWEIEVENNKGATKAEKKKEPTREHLLLREYTETARN